ncbi:MAG: GNAT family N-acetyltransferase [Chloroflexota bacterium]
MAGTLVTIAPLGASDLEGCVEIMSRSLPWTRYGMDEAAIGALWRSALDSGATVAVAHVEGVTAGFAWFIEQGGFGLSGYLKLLGVHPDRRGQGVGGVLLDHTEKLACRAGRKDLLLLVSDFNVAAQRFYQDRGYVQVGSIPDYVVPGVAELILRKRLREVR